MIASTLLCLDIMVIVSNLIPFIMLGSVDCNFSKFQTATLFKIQLKKFPERLAHRSGQPLHNL